VEQVIQLYTKLSECTSTQENQEALLREEFILLINYSLGNDYDPDRRNRLVELQTGMLQAKRRLEVRLYSGEIDGETFADGVNNRLTEILGQMMGILGYRDFEKLFGHTETSILLVDPQVSRDTHAERR